MYLEKWTVGALSPQALGTGLVLAILLIDLELLHLDQGQRPCHNAPPRLHPFQCMEG